MREQEYSEEESGGECKKRKISRACDACSTKHARCDGGEPCRKCREWNLVCTYQRQRLGQGPRRGWLLQLKTRFIAVESSLMASMDEVMDLVAPGTFKRDQIPDRSSQKPRDVIDGVLENLEIAVQAFRNEVWNARSKSWKSMSIPSFSFALPQNNACVHSNFSETECVRYIKLRPATSSLPTGNLPDVAWSSEEESVDTSSHGYSSLATASALDHDSSSTVSTLLRPVELFAALPPLPSPEIINSYVTQYFDYNWNYRFTRTLNPIHRPTFLATITKQSPLLLFAVLAIGALTSPENTIASKRQASDVFFSRCIKILQELPETATNNISFIQSLLLMCQYCYGFDTSLSEKFIQLAITKSRELMLTTDPSMQPDHCIQEIPGSPEWIKEEERRRTGWALFGADKIGSFFASSPPLLTDEELKLQPPASDDIWESNPSSTPPSSLLRNPYSCPVASVGPLEPMYIMGHAMSFRNRDWSKEHLVITEFERILAVWYKVFSEDSVPKLTPTNARALLLYHSTFVALHSPQDCLNADPSWLASPSYHKTLEHAFEVRVIVQRFKGCGIFLSPIPLNCIYQCASIWLCNVIRGGATSTADVKMAIQEISYYSAWWREASRLATELEQKCLAVTSRRV